MASIRSLFSFRILSAAAFAAAVIAASGCGSVPGNILATIGAGDTLTVPAFESAYLHTRQTPPQDAAQKTDFFDRLVDYRVKLAEAKALGIDRRKDVVSEIKDYRDQLARSYLLDRELVEPATRTLYERRKEGVTFAHIMIRWNRDAAGGIDTLSTYNEAEALLKKVRASTEVFDTLVVHYSEETNAETSKGRIGPIIAGTSLPQLDDILYTITPGEICPHLLRSQFGYHIVKLIARTPLRQRVRASQILYRLDINNPLDTAAGYARLSLILDSLKRGLATFEDLARRNSQDPVSGEKGGDLGWVDRGTNLEPHFEEALFNVPLGEVSPVVRSAFGMHIIKVTDESAARSYEEQLPELKAIYQKERFPEDYNNFMKRLRKKDEFRISPDVVKLILSKTDTSMNTSTPNWDRQLTTRDRDAFLFTVTGLQYPLRDAITEIKSDPALQMRPFTTASLDTMATMLADRLILVMESAGFEQRYPEFARLAREYGESTLISHVEQEQVWNTVTVSDEQVRAWWERHHAELVWPRRVAFSEIFVYSDVQARQLLDSIRAGADFAQLAARHTRRTGYFEKGGSWGWQPVDHNDLSRAASGLRNIGDVSGVLPQQPGGFSIVRLDGRDEPREKTFDEARIEARAKAREEALDAAMRTWLAGLKNTFNVREYPDHLENAFPQAVAR